MCCTQDRLEGAVAAKSVAAEHAAAAAAAAAAAVAVAAATAAAAGDLIHFSYIADYGPQVCSIMA